MNLHSRLYFCSPGRYLQIVCYSLLQACHSFKAYTLNSFQRAESHELSPGSGTLLAGELSSFLTLLTATGMLPPRALYHSILQIRWIQMVCFLTCFNRWWRSYILVCPFVYQADIFRLFGPESYKHATGLSLLLLYLSCSPDSHGLVPRPFFHPRFIDCS